MRALTKRQITKLNQNIRRHGESPLRVGECRTVAKGVTICRWSKILYERKTRRHTPRARR